MKNKLISIDEAIYILHRYYPEHRDCLTPLDWRVFLNLTNFIASCDSYHLTTDEPVYNRLKDIKEIVYSCR